MTGTRAIIPWGFSMRVIENIIVRFAQSRLVDEKFRKEISPRSIRLYRNLLREVDKLPTWGESVARKKVQPEFFPATTLTRVPGNSNVLPRISKRDLQIKRD